MSYKVRNVNLGFELMLEAVEEYTNYVMGLQEGNAVSAILGQKASDGNSPDPSNADKTDAKQARRVISRVLDRTAGGLCLSDIDNEAARVNSTATIPLQSIMTIVHGQSIATQDEKSVPDKGNDRTDFAAAPMNSCLKMIDPSIISRVKVEDKVTPEAGTEAEKDSEDPTKFKITLDPVSSEQPSVINELLNQKITNKDIDRFESPSLGALTIRHPKFSFSARQASHLPVFLSAITPLEMSRCAPYLDVKIITRKKPELGMLSTQTKKLGIYRFLRQELTYMDSFFENDAFAGSKGPYPIDAQREDQPDNFEKMYSYMDIFTSPQTMVNADINKGTGGFVDRVKRADDFEDFFDAIGEDYAQSNVRDPLQPFMSLLSFDVSIAGVGHGLMATKRAFLKLKLHDKSRIRDLSELLAPDEFAFTKFSIEFGWSHPDGDVTSTNVLGRYMNGLRDGGVYQLVGADYSFGGDNSVDITLQLVCTGFHQMKAISAAGGTHSNINVFQGVLDNILKEIQKQVSGGDDEVQAVQKSKDIRSKVRISNRNLRSRSTLIPFHSPNKESNLGLIRKALSDNGGPTDVAQKLLGFIFGDADGHTDIDLFSEEGLLSAESDAKLRAEAQAAGDMIFAKLYSLTKTPDPFITHVSNGFYEYQVSKEGADVDPRDWHLIGPFGTYNNPGGHDAAAAESTETKNAVANEHVSLGKILSMFVGYPMATCGLYDEVQMVFYPLNARSAGARKHTTASLPIEFNKLEEELHKRLNASEGVLNNLSVHGFFSLVDRIVTNKQITAYGLYNSSLSEVDLELQNYQKLDLEAKVTAANGATLSDAEKAAIQEAIDAAAAANAGAPGADVAQKRAQANAYKKVLNDRFNTNMTQRLEKVCKADQDLGLKGFYDPDRFTVANLSMYFETTTVAAPNGESDEDGFFKKIGKVLGAGRREVFNNGERTDKTILRIHVYDQNSSSNPDLAMFGTDSSALGVPLDQALENTLSDGDIIKKKSSYPYFKNLLMNAHPTIIQGASSGVVNSILVQSNTSGQLSNVLMVEAYDRSVNGGSAPGDEKEFEETVLFPTTVQLEMQGFPMLSRGCQIFIDFGTQTSLDNLYVVKTIDHSVSAGRFTTSAVLVASNQMAVTSFREKLLRKVKVLTA